MTRILRHALAAGVLLVACVQAGTAAGRTIAVPGDAPSIKGAMIIARPGDIVLVACGTYREFDILVKPGVSLWSGTLQPDCVTIDAAGQGRCLIFARADSTTRVVGFTLTGGVAGGGPTDAPEDGLGGAVFCDDASPVLSRCVLTGNTAGSGGALAASGARGPRLEQCTFDANEARRAGGAVYWTADSGELVACVMRENHAGQSGGAIAAVGGTLTVTRSLIAANAAGATGGAFDLTAAGFTASHCVVRGNRGGLSGGAIYARETAPQFSHCTFHANDVDGDATVLGLDGAAPRFEACLVTASAGPLVAGQGGTPEWQRSNIFVGDGFWPGDLAAQLNQRGNLASDPLYCSADSDDLHLRPGSPCLAADGTVIGALGTGCGAQFPPDVID